MIFAQGQPDFRLSGVAKFILLLVRVGSAACRAAGGSRSLRVSRAACRAAGGSRSLGVGSAACRAAGGGRSLRISRAACRTTRGSRLVSRVSGSAGCAGKSSYIL